MIAALPLLDVGHAFTLVATLLVALLSVGLGVLAGARRPELALSAGWGVAVLVLTLAGTLTAWPFTPVLAALGVVGLGGLGWGVRRIDAADWAASGRVLLLAAPFLLLAGAVTPASFDDYSHWLPNLGHLVVHDHYPSRADPNLISVRPGYPYATAFVGLAVSRLTGQLAEGAGVVWNALLLVSVGGMAAAVLAQRLEGTAGRMGNWGVAGLGVLLATLASPTFVPRLFLSNYGDGPVGSVAGVMLAALALAAVDRSAWRTVLALGFCGAALVSIRQDALSTWALVAGAALVLALLRRRLGLQWRLGLVALMLPAPLLAWGAWIAYQRVQIPGGAAGVLPIAAWHWAVMPAMLLSMLHIAGEKIGHFALLLAEGVAAVLVLRRPGRAAPLARAVLVLGALVGFGKIAGMAAIYLVVDFDAARVAQADEFWRFTVHVGPAVLVAGMALLPLAWLRAPVARGLAATAIVAMLVLPLAAAQWLRPDAPRRGHVPYLWLRGVAREIAQALPPGAALTLVDLDHHPLILPEIFPLRDRLALGEPIDDGTTAPRMRIIAGQPAMRVTVAGGLPDEAGAATDVATQYIWSWDGGPAASRLLGMALPAGQSVLLARQAGRLVVLKRWALPK